MIKWRVVIGGLWDLPEGRRCEPTRDAFGCASTKKHDSGLRLRAPASLTFAAP